MEMERSIFRLERERRNALTAARKERLERRRNALRNACEGLLVGRGWAMSEAAERAAWWVSDARKWAQRVMASMGYDYMDMTWRAS